MDLIYFVQATMPPYLGDSAGAGSPLNALAMAAVMQVLIIVILAIILIGGGILVVGRAMRSQRQQDLEQLAIRKPQLHRGHAA